MQKILLILFVFRAYNPVTNNENTNISIPFGIKKLDKNFCSLDESLLLKSY